MNYHGVLDYNLSEAIIIFLCGSDGVTETHLFILMVRVNVCVDVCVTGRGGLITDL